MYTLRSQNDTTGVVDVVLRDFIYFIDFFLSKIFCEIFDVYMHVFFNTNAGFRVFYVLFLNSWSKWAKHTYSDHIYEKKRDKLFLFNSEKKNFNFFFILIHPF